MTIGSKGDLLPFLGLAREMRALGHCVMMMSCEPYRQLCEREGFEFAPIMSTEDFHQLDAPELWTPIRGLAFYLKNCVAKSAPAVVEAVERQANRGPCVLVCNHMLAGGFIAAEKFDLPIVSVFLQPFSHVSAEAPQKFSPQVDRLLHWMGLRGRQLASDIVFRLMQLQIGGINRYRRSLGLAPWKNYFRETRYSANLVLGLWPEWFCGRKADWPRVCQSAGFVNTSGSESGWDDTHPLRDFLKREPIVFAMGSEMTQDFDANVKLFSETCKTLGRPGLFVSPVIRGQTFKSISPDFMVVESAPFTQIFAQASAIVCHGGIGTVAKALAAGRPILGLPMAYDQFDNAALIDRLGAGTYIPRATATTLRLTESLGHILDNPHVSASLKTLQQRMRRENGAITAAVMIDSTFRKAA